MLFEKEDFTVHQANGFENGITVPESPVCRSKNGLGRINNIPVEINVCRLLHHLAIQKYSEARLEKFLFEKIIKGDKFYTYKFMGVTDTEDYETDSIYIKACLVNDIMLKDPAVKQFIYRKLKKSINEAKFGKIYVEGFYHTLVGDMIGYLQYAVGKEVVGCLNAHEFYSETLPKGDILSFRSPLVCPSEVNKVKLVSNDITKKWLSHLKTKML